MRIRVRVMFSACFFWRFFAFAQGAGAGGGVLLRGLVTDENGSALPGVTVGEPAQGLNQIHTRQAEPRSARLFVSYGF